MSLDAMMWTFRHSQSTGSDRLVLLAIADAANAEGHGSCQSVSTIARMAKVSERTVWRSIKTLVELGELEKTGESKKYRTTIYSLPGVVSGAPVILSPPDKHDAGPLTNATVDPDTDGTLPQIHTRKDLPEKIVEPPAPTTTKLQDRNDSVEVKSLTERLYGFISSNLGRPVGPARGDYNTCRLMLDADSRDPREAWELMRWCQEDDFWMGNILSMTKFRKQYDKLLMQSRRKSKPSAEERNMALIREAERAEELQVQQQAAWAANWGSELAIPGDLPAILEEAPKTAVTDWRKEIM